MNGGGTSASLPSDCLNFGHCAFFSLESPVVYTRRPRDCPIPAWSPVFGNWHASCMYSFRSRGGPNSGRKGRIREPPSAHSSSHKLEGGAFFGQSHDS